MSCLLVAECPIFFLDCINSGIRLNFSQLKDQHECRIKVTCFFPDVEWLPAGFLFVLYIIIALFIYLFSEISQKS
jgi:hypothetical protein